MPDRRGLITGDVATASRLAKLECQAVGGGATNYQLAEMDSLMMQ